MFSFNLRRIKCQISSTRVSALVIVILNTNFQPRDEGSGQASAYNTYERLKYS